MVKHLCIECNQLGGKLRSGLDIRLCDNCKESKKYKLITKKTSKDKYNLTEKDLENINFFPVNNPHYRSGSFMLLYLEKEIFACFLNKHIPEKSYIKFEETDDEYIEELMFQFQNKNLEKYLKKYKDIDLYYKNGILANNKEIIKEFKQSIKDKEIKKLLLENNLEELYSKYLCTEKKSAKNIIKELIVKQNRKDELLKAISAAGLTFRTDSRLYQQYIDGENEISLESIIQIMIEMI